MGRRKRFALNINQNSTFTLSIASMTDMFTLLLVFLLQNFATSSVEIKPQQNLALPTSNSYKNPILSVQISVSTDDIKVNDKLVARIQNRDIASADVDPQDTNFIQPLFKELQAIALVPALHCRSPGQSRTGWDRSSGERS